MPLQAASTLPRPPRTSVKSRNWESLSREEQQRQIRDLIGSPYWVVLPLDIQERFLDLYRSN
ncbi:hypothetical protein DBW_0765 [Desulfuromonas sp. DDH964]|uniref:hypothetical protein n=1 Tax=Desulfuromonas sp. DDH964 TaxID=1823759 RepID=UPI00078D1292|nr:hypothetical protein [Desulfuromonas sp. DDH964]AMV71148.1 hypothetical protein DBW_0765 [Desulfuromonas sp. DDH964]